MDESNPYERKAGIEAKIDLFSLWAWLKKRKRKKLHAKLIRSRERYRKALALLEKEYDVA